MGIEIIKDLLEASTSDETWNEYCIQKRKLYERVDQTHVKGNLVSEANWILRRNWTSSLENGLQVEPGDLCYIDFGQAYLNEAGYQHFGLILQITHYKALVLPMTSNPETYKKAYDSVVNPQGKKHLFALPALPKMNKKSVLFLNDAKYINSARIIDRKGHISVDSDLFLAIKCRFLQLLMEEGSQLLTAA